MWRILDQGREPLRYKLATLAGCSPDEVAVNRNATEALNTVIYGLELRTGGEVIDTKQDYPNMIQAWRQRALRDGIRYTQLNFDFPIEEEDEIVAVYEKAIDIPLDSALFDQYKIHTVGIVWENISCVRITPHVYTRIAGLDKLVQAIETIAAGRKKADG